jgi:2-phospho-L-lactate guanylyltransferase
MTLWAVVPVKGFERAKTRLSSVLDPSHRAALAKTLFEHVIGAVRAAPGVHRVAVVTNSGEVARLATELGALALTDPENAKSLADRVDFALAQVERHGATSAVVVMSDLPALTSDDIGEIAGELSRTDVVVAPDARGRHTNALALRLPASFRTHFGDPDSLERHAAAARDAGLSVHTLVRPGLAFDVDTDDDYGAMKS